MRWLRKSTTRSDPCDGMWSEDHPAVALVDQFLEAVAPRTPATGPHVAAHALWVSPDNPIMIIDALDWLIYDDGDGVAWCKLPGEVRQDDVVTASKIGGGHTSPEGFLLWLRGQSTQPWPDDDYLGDPAVLEELGRKIRRT